jgi:nuclear pore complex protein Nup93
LNDFRLKSLPFGLIHSFVEASKGQNDQLSDCFSSLAYMLKEENVVDGRFQQQALSENHYARSPNRYLLVNGAKKYLESQMLNFVEKVIQQQPREAVVGGRPYVIDKIKGYLNVKFRKFGHWDESLEVVNNVPIFAVVFYLIRCGFWKEALDYCLENEEYIAKKDKNFLAYMKGYMTNDFKLPKTLSSAITADYAQKTRFQHEDKFKMCIYKIIGRCDLTKKTVNEIILTKEDYIWLQVTMILSIYTSFL